LDLDGKKIIEWCPYTIAEVISYKATLDRLHHLAPEQRYELGIQHGYSFAL
jgi:hypothetical protein